MSGTAGNGNAGPDTAFVGVNDFEAGGFSDNREIVLFGLGRLGKGGGSDTTGFFSHEGGEGELSATVSIGGVAMTSTSAVSMAAMGPLVSLAPRP